MAKSSQTGYQANGAMERPAIPTTSASRLSEANLAIYWASDVISNIYIFLSSIEYLMRSNSLISHSSSSVRKVGRSCFAIVSILSLSASYSLAKKIDSNVPYEIRGYCQLADSSLFSVKDLQTGGSRWVEKNQPFGAITMLNFDSKEKLFTAVYQGREVYLKIRESDNIPLFVLGAEPTSKQQLTTLKVEQLVKEHERNLMNNLPEETHRLHSVMRVSMNNKVNAYKADLDSKLEKQSTTDMAADTNQVASNVKPRIGNLHKSNAVNSRIWASDHIEFHGEPQ